MKARYYAVLASFLMVTMAFAVVATAEDETISNPGMNALENFEKTKEYIAEMDAQGIYRYDTAGPDVDLFEYTDGPYPIYADDGSPPGTQHMPWGSHYVSDVSYSPPNSGGGWWMIEAMGGSGEFSGGNSHETYFIGDQNGNGVLEWLAGFSYKTFGEDGIDNDGDGCIDEKAFEQWDPSRGTGCDLLPDHTIYYENGGLVDSGGDTGDLLTNVDWWSPIQATEVYRAFVTPRWMAYQLRGNTQYPDVAGEFISYYAYEGSNGVNANPEMDSDQSDYYVGVIDARGFPARPPVDRACAAGRQAYMGHTAVREDGTVIIAFYLYEYYDASADWNGDGDSSDYVAAYFALDPTTGNCRQNAVNTGVWGYFPTSSGDLITPMYTSESSDRRDWDGNGMNSGYRKLYHDVDTTIAMKGNVYTSFTFTASVPAWGFGWWALYETTTYRTYPGKNFVGFQKYVGFSQGYYHTYFVQTEDEDGNRHTLLPQYFGTIGYPGQALGGQCLWITGRENYLGYAGMWLMPTIPGDSNGDYYLYQFAVAFFCPNDTGGGGQFIVEETSKFAKGLYRDPYPAVMLISYSYFYDAAGTAGGLCMAPGNNYETYHHDDLDGNLQLRSSNYGASPNYYWIQFTKPDFEFVPGSLDWVFTGDVQPGGTVMGTFDLINTGGMDIKIKEDKGIENDKGFKLQGLSARDRIGPDGVMEPQEAATFFFAMTVSAGAPIGPLDVKIIVDYSGVTKEETIVLPIILKMFGDDQSCYRHRQNAMRTLRAFDMDDDGGMLHNLEPGDLVLLDGAAMAPEDAVLLLISFFEGGCRASGHNDVEHAHSASSGLTGHYGMGMEYWGFAPGQEEGNEGNGNGGLTGQDRKDVYGF
jgi:hypothetical protein